MAVTIAKSRLLQLPTRRLPADRPNVYNLTSTSGPWESYSWQGRPLLAATTDRLPVVWAGRNVNFLAPQLNPPATRLFLPARGWGVKGSLVTTPRSVLIDFAFVDQVVATVGKDTLDKAGIAIAYVPGAGGYQLFASSWNSLRYGLPCQGSDVYTPPFTDISFPSSITVGHAEADQFVGGEVLFITALQLFYGFQSIETGRPYRYDAAGVAHDVAELNRCRSRFAKARWVHYKIKLSPVLDPTLDDYFVAAIAAAGSADVIGHLVTYPLLSSQHLADIAGYIRDFFNL